MGKVIVRTDWATTVNTQSVLGVGEFLSLVLVGPFLTSKSGQEYEHHSSLL